MKERLTPHEFYITQDKGTERPFTGEHWWRNEVGRYDCKVCSQRLFLYEHKYQHKSGFATFWNTLKDAVNLRSDSLEVPHFTNAHIDPSLRYKQPIKRATCSNVSEFCLEKARICFLTDCFFDSVMLISAMFTTTVQLHSV